MLDHVGDARFHCGGNRVGWQAQRFARRGRRQVSQQLQQQGNTFGQLDDLTLHRRIFPQVVLGDGRTVASVACVLAMDDVLAQEGHCLGRAEGGQWCVRQTGNLLAASGHDHSVVTERVGGEQGGQVVRQPGPQGLGSRLQGVQQDDHQGPGLGLAHGSVLSSHLALDAQVGERLRKGLLQVRRHGRIAVLDGHSYVADLASLSGYHGLNDRGLAHLAGDVQAFSEGIDA